VPLHEEKLSVRLTPWRDIRWRGIRWPGVPWRGVPWRGAATDPDEGRNTTRFAVGFFVAIFLLLGGLYAAGYALTSDRVPRQVTVAGVDIGGLRPEEAQAKLRRELDPRATRPLLAQHADRTIKIDPRKAGLRLDVAATVREAGGGHSWSPMRMIEVLTGGKDIAPVVDVDERALEAELRDVAGRVGRKPVQGGIHFTNGRAVPVYPTPGWDLDVDATADAAKAAFLQPDRAFDLPVERVSTRLNDKDIDAAMEQFAEPAMSAPVTVLVGGKVARLTPRRIGAALTMVGRHGRLVPRIDDKVFLKRVADPLDPLTKDPRPATVVLRGGSPAVVAGNTGTAIDRKGLADKVLSVLRKHGRARSVTLKARTVEPHFGTDDARKLGVNEVVSDFTTYFPGDESYRNVNLGRAAELINGSLLKPGQTFSLNDTVGERTATNGFTKGYIIDNGKLVEDYGGGVSQVATTTYNAAFFAGMKDVEHHPHSLYFDRYPMGREATVAWGAFDLRFQNTTPYGVLIQAWIKPSTPSTYGEMHVRMWSTKYWTIKAGLSDRYDFTDYKVTYDTSKDCFEQAGYDGFDVDVFRYFYRDGQRVKTEKDHVKYDPYDTVHCRQPPNRNRQASTSGGR
jgi:vancomycin resistance protein YoaR